MLILIIVVTELYKFPTPNRSDLVCKNIYNLITINLLASLSLWLLIDYVLDKIFAPDEHSTAGLQFGL